MELTIQNITHRYGNLCALNNVSIVLTPGIYGFLGPNGSGKSTLMNIITGNLHQTSGEILWDGINVRENSHSFYHALGYMPQIQTFYPNFTAQEFMYYIASLKDMHMKEADTEIHQLLSKLELYTVRDHKIKTFSGGMRQRLLLGQALLNHPNLLILDEPTAGMDPKQRIAIARIIGELSKDSIVLISTHIVSDIEYIAKEVILLKKGQILTHDSVASLCSELQGMVFDVHMNDEQLTLFENDRNKIITGYIRDMNGMRARIIRDTPPAYTCEKAIPTLEEVYMHYFEEAQHVF